MRNRIGAWMRRWADRIDPPKSFGAAFSTGGTWNTSNTLASSVVFIGAGGGGGGGHYSPPDDGPAPALVPR